MTRECHVRFREGGGVRFPSATRRLAKALAGDMSNADLSQSPTMTATMGGTREGVILGTAAYMSPEQARGKPLDKRTDIWSFGCVLFEMLTGRAVFAGETLSDTIGRVMEREPDWGALPEGVPPGVRLCLRRCLRKDLTARFRDVADAAIVLDEGAVEQPSTESGSRSQLSRRRGAAVAWAVAAAAVALALVGWWPRLIDRPLAQDAPERFMLIPPTSPGVGAVGSGLLDIAISPDGARAVYTSRGGRATGVHLFTRPLDTLDAMPLERGQDGWSPFFSPDGQWVGFYEGGGMMSRVPSTGGARESVARIGGVLTGASWAADDTILFGVSGSGLFRVAAAGGEPVAVTTIEDDDAVAGHRQAHVLPGGKTALFTVQASDGESHQVAVLDIATSDWSVLTPGSTPRYAASGHLVYAREGDLYAARFDLDAVAITSPARPIVRGVEVKDSSDANFAISRSGTLLHVEAGADLASRNVVWVHPDGREEPTGIPPGLYSSLRLSPDGSRLALEDANDLAVWDFDRSRLRRLVTDAFINRLPVWSPDGSSIVFASNRAGGAQQLYRMQADGTDAVEPLLLTDEGAHPRDWTRSGLLVFSEGGQLGVLNVRDRTVEPRQVEMANMVVSPSERWIAYAVERLGQQQIVVGSFSTSTDGETSVVFEGGTMPRWSPHEDMLFFHDTEGRLMAVRVLSGDTFDYEEPELILDTGHVPSSSLYPTYDIAADGRFIGIKESAASIRGSDLVITRNWFTDLAEQVP